MAVRPGGRGDVTASHIVWQTPTGAPYISSLVHDAGLIYLASDVGGVTVVDAATGQRVWQQRINGIFSASPVAGDGEIYFARETGGGAGIRSGRPPEVLGRNDIGVGGVCATTISDGHLFLRSDNRITAIRGY